MRGSNLKKVLFFALMDVVWLLGFAFVVTVSAAPVTWLLVRLHAGFGPWPTLLAAPAVVVLVGLNLYILVVGALHRLLVPRLEEGVYEIPSRQWLAWRLNWTLYSYVFLFVNRYMLFNKFIKTPFMKLMGASVHYTTYFGETADLQDMNSLLSFGRNTLIGSEVTMASHLIIGERTLLFRRVRIGDGCLVGARSSVAPGVTLGDNVILQYQVALSVGVTVGSGTTIEPGVSVGSKARIGQGCRVGLLSIIAPGAEVPDGAVVPPYSVWRGPRDIQERPPPTAATAA